MHIGKYLTLALVSATAIAAQSNRTTTQGRNGTTTQGRNGTTTGNANSTIYELLTAPNNHLNTSKFVSLVTSDSGYKPIIDLLQQPGNLTAFVPNDKILTKILGVWKTYARTHKLNSTGEYPPANMSFNNITISDLLSYHVVGERVNLTNLTDSNISLSVVHSLANQSNVAFFNGSGLPLLIENNATWEQFHNQTWMNANSSYLQYEIGNGLNETEVLIKDINATNGLLNVIASVLIPPMKPSIVIDQVDDLDDFENLIKQYPAINNTLNNSTNFTLFAPTSEALKRVDFQSMNNDTIQALFLNHLIPGVYFTPNITANALTNQGNTNFTSFSNVTFPAYFNSTSGNITLNDTTNIVQPNIFFNNGVMHVIDGIINSTSANANVTETGAAGPTNTGTDISSEPTDTASPTDSTSPTDTASPTDQSDPNNQGGQTDPNDQGGQTDPNDQGGQTDPNNQGGQTDPNDQGGQTDPNDQNGQTDNSGQNDQSGPTATEVVTANPTDMVTEVVTATA